MYKEFKKLINSKVYMLIIVIAAIASYGFVLTHSGIGTDDPAVNMYYGEGLAPYIGRWTLFLLGKVLHITEYAPFFVDFVGVIFLVIAATMWLALLKSYINELYVPDYISGLIGALFVSSPIVSEIFIYSLHGGIGLGYILIFIAVYYFVRSIDGCNCLREDCPQKPINALFSGGGTEVFLFRRFFLQYQ